MKATNDRWLYVLIFFCGAPLFALYIAFLVYLPPITTLLTDTTESIIFYTLFIRTALLLLVPSFRRIAGQFKIGILSIESFVLVGIIAWFLFTGDPYFNTLIGEILTSWIAAGLVIITPYSILEFMINMRKSPTITSFLTSLVTEFAAVLFSLDIVSQLTPVPTNLEQLGISLLGFAKVGGTGLSAGSPSDVLITSTSLILYVSAILYIVSRHDVPGRTFLFPFILIFTGTIVVALWSSVALNFELQIFIALSAPAIAIPLILWVISRGKK
jgi:hypothetical protein